MDSEIIIELDSLLDVDSSGSSFSLSEIPDNLHNTKFIEEEIRPPKRCPKKYCREICEVVQSDEETIIVICDHDHETKLPKSDHAFADINFSEILESVFTHLQLNLELTDESELPRYISGVDNAGNAIYIIGSPSDYQTAVNEIFAEISLDERPTLLITPKGSISHLLETQAMFASGNLVYSIPFSMLQEPEEIKSSLKTIIEIEELENGFIENLDDEDNIIYRANSNPRYILTELNHMRLLRISGELPQSSGKRLERIGESVFSHLFVTHSQSGGEDDRGKNLPDTLFYIPESSKYSSILGIVDTKSGADAGFGSESIEGKHTNYLKRGRRASVSAENLAHIFVILDFDGQQELQFYDEMSDYYETGEYMIIMTASAMSMIMAGYLAHTVTNELKLVTGSFREVILPLFEKDAFRDKGLKGIVRDVGQNQEQYRDKYLSREGLLIVTTEVVKQRFRDCAESPTEIETIFESYHNKLPTA